MPESLTLNSGKTSALTLTDDANGITVVSHEYPAPAPKMVWAGSIDSEGSRSLSDQYENREITLELETTTEAKLASLQETVALIGREGGTLTWVTPGGNTVIFDLLKWSSFEGRFDIGFSVANHARVQVTFPAKPFGRGTEVDLGDNTEITAPCLIFTEAAVGGDVPALGRLVIDDDSAQNQAWVVWGLESRHYSADASAALFFEAQTLTTLGSSTTTVGASGAYSSAVVRNTDLLGDAYLAVLEGEISATSDVFSHVGDFRVFARCYTPTGNSGALKVALEWGQGDKLSLSRNTAVTYSSGWEGSWRLIDLGTVSLSEVLTGSQQWTCRIVVQGSTGVNGEEIDVDWLMLVPTERAGEASANQTDVAPSSYPARDSFDQTSGALNGKTATAGGTWATSGSTTDFQVSGSGNVTRTTTSDAGPRYAVLGTTNFTNVAVFADVASQTFDTSSTNYPGLIARWTDASNFLFLRQNDTDGALQLYQRVSGTDTLLGSTNIVVGQGTRLTLKVFSDGQWTATVALHGSTNVLASMSGTSSALATGGTLASGECGLIDYNGSAFASTRTYDNFYVYEPVLDAAMYASQSLQVRHDGVIREDSAGAIWSPVSKYEGDLLTIPPTGPENRTNRLIVKASRGLPGSGIDTAADDISARLYATPRYLVIPS